MTAAAPRTVIEAPPDKIRRLAEMQERLRQAHTDSMKHRVFPLLGYEPACVPRVVARESGVAEDLLPPMCGQCSQELFFAATEFDVLLAGSLGGGKSLALLMQGIHDCATHAGLRVGAFRLSYPELEASLLAELGKWGFARALGAVWNGSEKSLIFPNSSVMIFRYAENLKDASRQQGGAFQRLLIDERTLMPPEVVTYLESRLRSGRRSIPVLGIRSSANPGGVGHGAVKARYIDEYTVVNGQKVAGTNYGQRTYPDARGRLVRFIPSRTADNPYLNAEYRTDLAGQSEAQRAAFQDGSWDSFSGQYFPEWNRDRHVIRPFPIPPQWHRVAGVDKGNIHPWAVEWVAQDGDGRAYVYREIYRPGVNINDQGRLIAEAEAPTGEQVTHFGGHDLWGKVGEQHTAAERYRLADLRLVQADISRIPGWDRMRTYLNEAPACDSHRAQGWDTCPLLHIFSTCTGIISELPNLVHDRLRPEDLTKTSDDAADALRYALMALPDRPRVPPMIVPDNPRRPATVTSGLLTADF